MKVAFWSNVRGKSCVTSNLACISILSSMFSEEMDHRSIVFENHQNFINLGNLLFSHNSENFLREESVYRVNRGMSQVLRAVEEGQVYSGDIIFQNARECLGDRLLYLPNPPGLNSEVLEYQMDRNCHKVLGYLERFGHRVFVDTTAAPVRSSRKILQEADLIVVNLVQNETMLDQFFRNYRAIREKAFYLIGNYDENSVLTRDYIGKTYGISERQIGLIPRHTAFLDAVSSGEIVPFLERGMRGEHDPFCQEFFDCLRETVDLFEESLEAFSCREIYA
ncbi:MAG: hypothetical protein K6G62_02755 [Eubacterium sp.]|nr:hypothetical protein [Eubacterium sp.]